MKFSKFLAPVAVAAASLFAASASQAALLVEISSGGTTVTIEDNGTLDGYGFVSSIYGTTTGLIGYAGAVGDWDLSLAVASGTANPFAMSLSAIVGGAGGEGPITIKLTQTDLAAGVDPYVLFGNGGGAGYGTAGWQAWVDDSNAAFGQGSLLHSSPGYGGSGFSGPVSLSGSYSATLIATFDYTSFSQALPITRTSSIDLKMGVPEPASLALVGLALLGAGFASRRKA